MKKLITMVVVGLTFGLFSSAHAFYGGVNYMFTNVDIGSGIDFDPGVLVFKAGQEVNDYFAMEGRFGFGVVDDDIAGVVDFEVDYYWGLYARGGYKIDRTNLYALLGFAGAEGTLSSPFTPDLSESDTGFSYGLGVEFMVSEKVGINLEYLVLPDIEDADVESFGLGVSFAF